MPFVSRLVEIAILVLVTASFISCADTTTSPSAPSQIGGSSQSAMPADTRPPDIGGMRLDTEDLDAGVDPIGLTPINMKGTWVGGFTSAQPTTAMPCAWAGTMKSVTLVVSNQTGNKVSGYLQLKGLKKTAGPDYCRNLTNFMIGFGNNGVITGNKVKITDNTGGVWQLSLTGISKVAGLASGTVIGGQSYVNGTVKLSRIKL